MIDFFAFNLQWLIHRGSVVSLLFPVKLVSIAKHVDHGRFLSFGRAVGLPVTSDPFKADFVLGEPVYFNEHGFCVHHSQSKFWSEEVIGVASLSQYSDVVPSDCDLVPGRKVLTEKGVLNLENITHFIS